MATILQSKYYSQGTFSLKKIFQELSGLGDRKKLNAASIEDRYNFTGIAAKTRSIISLGLSTFRRVAIDKDDVKAVTFHSQTFDIMVLCSEDYIVEPASLKFLVEHGFNFIKQYSKGLTYYRGNDKVHLAFLKILLLGYCRS